MIMGFPQCWTFAFLFSFSWQFCSRKWTHHFQCCYDPWRWKSQWPWGWSRSHAHRRRWRLRCGGRRIRLPPGLLLIIGAVPGHSPTHYRSHPPTPMRVDAVLRSHRTMPSAPGSDTWGRRYWPNPLRISCLFLYLIFYIPTHYPPSYYYHQLIQPSNHTILSYLPESVRQSLFQRISRNLVCFCKSTTNLHYIP